MKKVIAQDKYGTCSLKEGWIYTVKNGAIVVVKSKRQIKE